MLLNFITFLEEAVMCKEKLYRDFPLLSISFACYSGEVLAYYFLVLYGQNPYS